MPRPTLALTLQTKVGRRIVLLFVLSALLPVAALAALGYAQVRRQLVARSEEQLAEAAKGVGMGVLDHLRAAQATLEEAELALRTFGRDALGPEAGLGRRARSVFTSLAVERDGTIETLWGPAPERGGLQEGSARLLGEGRAVLALAGRDTAMAWLVLPAPAARARLWAAPASAHLFLDAGERAVVGGAELEVCVRESGQGRALYCEAGRGDGGAMARADWVLFLGYDYGVAPWRVQVGVPMATVLAPAQAFRRTFLATVVLVLALVVFLSHVQVRRSLQPLTELRNGTRRLASRDFSGTVAVASHDEFEDLAASFNDMAGELDRQFRNLTAVEIIDQAALTSARGEEVAATAAQQLLRTLGGVAVDVCLAGERPGDPWRLVRAMDGGTRLERAVRPAGEELQHLFTAVGGFVRNGGDGFSWLDAVAGGPVAIVPLVSRDELLGLVAVHTADGAPASDDLLRQTRQMSDKVAVGLSNARLIVRLDQLSYGALAALARTIDASSHWTAGHSERVTALSLRMADRLGLDAAARDALHRGGLLHDIGKIGIPPHILDKPGPLDEVETARIREHPALGARILAPISAFTDAIPIVRYHHEKMDGTGYPDGLRGSAIPHGARLLAVADVYDALVSSRPYRPGWSFPYALDTIRIASGSHFDPVMVAAFLDVMKDEGDEARFSLRASAETGA